MQDNMILLRQMDNIFHFAEMGKKHDGNQISMQNYISGALELKVAAWERSDIWDGHNVCYFNL